MPYFKERVPKRLNRPSVIRVSAIQAVVMLAVTGLIWVMNQSTGIAFGCGSIISLIGQMYFNFLALKRYGDSEVSGLIVDTYRAMWSKWLIIVSASLAVILAWQEIQALALYSGVFVSHTLGALLLPVLVKNSRKVDH